MARRRSGSGMGGLFKSAVWMFVAACICVAVWNSFPHTDSGVGTELHNQGEKLKNVGTNLGSWIDNKLPNQVPSGGTNDPQNTAPVPLVPTSHGYAPAGSSQDPSSTASASN